MLIECQSDNDLIMIMGGIFRNDKLNLLRDGQSPANVVSAQSPAGFKILLI